MLFNQPPPVTNYHSYRDPYKWPVSDVVNQMTWGNWTTPEVPIFRQRSNPINKES
jgi:hypothetical protein